MDLWDEVSRGPVWWAKGLPPRAELGVDSSNGSRALQASLARCLRILSTTRGSVTKEDDFHLRSAGTQKRVHL
jgi:hypothetical protein